MTDVALNPLHVFRFEVEFQEAPLNADSGTTGEQVTLAKGAFSEVTGLEASMEPKVIKEGGRNYGAHQRVGPVSFGTVVLKRGITTNRNLWQWWSAVAQGGYTYRLDVTIRLLDTAGVARAQWKLEKCLPTKFKTVDLNATGSDVGVEELHLAIEGLVEEKPPDPPPSNNDTSNGSGRGAQTPGVSG